MPNLTYLIGAGASCQALPLVKDIPERLKNFKNVCKRYDLGDENNIQETDRNKFVKDLDWLIEECINHASIDTFAKKLYLAGQEEELLKLKIILNKFFVAEQLLKGVDKRYDAFFAALLNRGPSGALVFPKDIKVISWNYDRQIEFSIGQFDSDIRDDPDNDKQTRLIERKIQIYPQHEKINIDTWDTDLNPNEFCIFKLNGTFGGSLVKTDGFKNDPFNIIKFTKENNDPIVEQEIKIKCLGNYSNTIDAINTKGHEIGKLEPAILFAWEERPLSEKVRSLAIRAIQNTEYLIIIGYSFPTFNRSIDKEILSSINPRKIYIQDIESGVLGVEQRLSSILGPGATIEGITNVDEFYVPYEY